MTELLIFTPEPADGASDAAFWGDDEFDITQAIAQAAAIGSLTATAEVKEERHAMRRVALKKRGNISGLGKHLAKKYGPTDEGFFTRCMSASELAGYDEETRKAVCAKAHKVQIGHWPGDKKPFNESKECCRRVVRVRRKR